MAPTPTRTASEAPSSSSSDFYAADPPSTDPPHVVSTGADADAAMARAHSPELDAPEPTTAPLPGSANGNGVADDDNADDDDDDDSGSEMDCSSPSAPPSPRLQSAPAMPQPAAVATNHHAGAKRKLSDTADVETPTPLAHAEDPAKKRKLVVSALPVDAPGTPPRTARLPAEVWQRVFMHLSPVMLCRCLRVCKPFNLYLTHLAASPVPRASKKQDQTPARVVDSESIWIHARKNYFTIMPRPLAAFSELDMLKLVGGRTCQFCARTPTPSAATSLFTAGPGANGLRVIWPFGIRACGTCLEARILKDIQVLSDPSLSQLRLGVPYGFRSPELHFVTDSVRQMPGGIPGNLRFAKVYYVPDLEAIKAEEENAQTLGDGAADEWRKGLAAQGKDAMADCARWERWELQMRPGADLSQVLRECDISSFPRYLGETHGRSAGVNGAQVQPPTVANGTHPLPQPVHVFHNAHNGHVAQFQPQLQHQPQPQHPPQAQHQLPFAQHHRPMRNPQEVEEARQARKADIERRCRELEPPVEPNVLQHMESFQAAMQITTPMTDASWNMLKPRILDQRERAEYVEHERASQLAALQAAMPSSMLADFIPKPAKETYDREYEQSQDPLRRRLGEYATDYINGQWGGGKMLERDNSPIFAAHVLLHVYKRYTEDKQLGLLPKPESNPRKAHARQGSPMPDPFLSLDNMKFVYDNKVRPLTDPLRREQFICSGCTEEKKPKWFAFEGLIQHYGAKHTTAFSRGNIVVHWQTSDWPEEAPFHTNPGHWLKPDRRVSAHNRTRNTPQVNNDTSFQVQTSKHHDSSYYASSNGHNQNGALLYQALQHPQVTSNGYHYPAEAVESEPVHNYDQQVDRLSKDARETWDAMDGVKDLLECIRVHTAIHHGSERFNEAFRQKPTLDMLAEAVTTNALARPMKNAHGLACKSCVAAPSNGVPNNGSYWTRIRSAKLYNTSSLVTHFKLMHQVQDFGQLDWTIDMIELPDKDMIRDLLRTPGMDDNKLALVAAAFPGVFSLPLPTIGVVYAQSETGSEDAPASRLPKGFGKKQKPQNQPKKKGQKKANGSVDRDVSQDPLPEPTEDEYDPRRPMFVPAQNQSFDPAQFDTDARKVVDPSQFDTDARKPPEAMAPATATSNTFNLAPETLAALQSLTAITSQPTSSRPRNRYSRSPSVGRSVPGSVSRAGPGPSVATSAGQPDIAAILASLTGQTPAAHHATPPAAAVNHAGSPLRQAQYNQPPFDEARRPVSRYSGSYQPQPDPAVARDAHNLQAALSTNARQFEQNQHQTYGEAPQAPPAHLAPRYQYVYEGEQHYSQPPSRTPVYREAPVQYVQRPDSEHVPIGYQYERPPPQTIYVDQYGRPLELIPIDSAPAQVQYAPSYVQQYDRRAEQPVYPNMAHAAHMQPVHDDRRPVYYEQAPPGYAGWDENARASVPRS